MPSRCLTLPLLLVCVGCGAAPATAPDLGSDAASADAEAVDLGPPDMPDAGCRTDLDGDGHVSIGCGGDDCDDADPSRYPGNAEYCDPLGHDEDCNPATLGPDRDADGFISGRCCDQQPDGSLLCGDDCDDTRATVNPSAVESCNGADDNCNGVVDEGALRDSWRDADGDGFGDLASPCAPACMPPTGCVTLSNDCDDTTAARHPGNPEICNALDDDCNPATLEPTITCYQDADGDGYRSTTPMAMCSCAAGWLPASAVLDCYDANALAHPGSSPATWYTTSRGDGSFDYDCDGVGAREINSVVIGGCSPGAPIWRDTLPNCGETGTLITMCFCSTTTGCTITGTMPHVQGCH